jgi:hypothetical protein
MLTIRPRLKFSWSWRMAPESVASLILVASQYRVLLAWCFVEKSVNERIQNGHYVTGLTHPPRYEYLSYEIEW